MVQTLLPQGVTTQTQKELPITNTLVALHSMKELYGSMEEELHIVLMNNSWRFMSMSPFVGSDGYCETQRELLILV